MLRALALFTSLVALFFGVGFYSRAVLHLDCVGPVIEGWGCLATPYPAVLPGNSKLLFDLGVGVGGFILCLMVKDVVWSAAGLLAALLFPRWARRSARPEPARSYRVR